MRAFSSNVTQTLEEHRHEPCLGFDGERHGEKEGVDPEKLNDRKYREEIEPEIVLNFLVGFNTGFGPLESVLLS